MCSVDCPPPSKGLGGWAKNVARSGKNVFNPTLPHPWKEMATNGIDSNVFPTECEVELFEIKKELFKKNDMEKVELLFV